MARITVEDCLENVDNRFELVMQATKRARQLATGGKEPMVKEDSDKATVIALREIAEGLVTEAVLEDTFEEADSTEELAEGDQILSEAEELQAAGLVEQAVEIEEAAGTESQEGEEKGLD